MEEGGKKRGRDDWQTDRTGSGGIAVQTHLQEVEKKAEVEKKPKIPAPTTGQVLLAAIMGVFAVPFLHLMTPYFEWPLIAPAAGLGRSMGGILGDLAYYFGAVGVILSWLASIFMFCVPSLICSFLTAAVTRFRRLMWVTFSTGMVVEIAYAVLFGG